jgi:transcriptional regulator with XRE-family HTH domain
MSVGETIYKLRIKNGLTQKQLADKLNVSPDLVSKWECGSRRPDYATINALETLFGESFDSVSGINARPLSELNRCIPADIDASELHIILNEYVNTLSIRDGNIFILRYYFFESIKNIAGMLNMNPNTVGLVLFRTRKKLTDYIKGDEPHEKKRTV